LGFFFQKENEMVNDIFYMVEHKRLRETYQWETILRHEQKIMAALRSRHEAQLRLHLTAATPRNAEVISKAGKAVKSRRK